MINSRPHFYYLFIVTILLLPFNNIGQNRLLLDDYAFACTDGSKGLQSAIDSGCSSFVFSISQNDDLFYLQNSSDKNLFPVKLDSIIQLTTERTILVFTGNYNQEELKEYLDTKLDKNIFFADWEEWPLVSSFFEKQQKITAFLSNNISLISTDSSRIDEPYHGHFLSDPLNKFTVYNPELIEPDSLTPLCFYQWELSGLIPNFIVVSNNNYSHAVDAANTLNKSRRFKGEIKFDDLFLNEIYWKQLPGTVTPGKFSFPLQSNSTILSPYKNGYKITPGEIIHNIGMEDITRPFNAYKTTIDDKLKFHFQFEKNAINAVDKTWDNIILKGAEWIVDSERNNVAHFSRLNSFIDYSKENTLNFNTPISVSAWVKPDSILQYMGIIGFGTAFSLKLRNSKLDFTTATIKDHVVDSVLKTGNWAHVGIVFNPGATVDLYLNGIKTKSMLASDIKSSKHSLVIGNNVWGEQFFGAIDELMIWDRGLSEEEFANLYLNQLSPKPKFNSFIIIIIGLFFLIIVIVISLSRRKNLARNRNKTNTKSRFKSVSDINYENKIEIFGAFNIVSKKGGNISKSFSPLLKQLLSFFILNTINSENGFTTKTINDTFWPGFTKAQAKENRGTNIQKLRKLLGQIPGVHIIFHEKKWLIEFNEETQTDFFIYVRLKNELKKQLELGILNTVYLKEYLSILKKGNILQNIESEWLDVYKNNISIDVITLLLQLYTNIHDDSLKIEIARTILLFDDLNEDALRILVEQLTKSGNHGQAKQIYEDFSKRYTILYNEPYPLKFSSLHSK